MYGRKSNYIAVHVRRRDYLAHKESLGVLSRQYYKEALGMVMNSRERALIRFYSDSPDWIWNNLSFFSISSRYEVQVVDFNREDDPALVLHEMSHADVLISSNSTLSLLAGFFCQGEVIVPEVLRRKEEIDELTETLPSSWAKIKTAWEE